MRPSRHVRTTRSFSSSHPFLVSLPYPEALSHKSSLVPRTCDLWSFMSYYTPQNPKTCLPSSPESTELILTLFPFSLSLSSFLCWGFDLGTRAFPQQNRRNVGVTNIRFTSTTWPVYHAGEKCLFLGQKNNLVLEKGTAVFTCHWWQERVWYQSSMKHRIVPLA